MYNLPNQTQHDLTLEQTHVYDGHMTNNNMQAEGEESRAQAAGNSEVKPGKNATKS